MLTTFRYNIPEAETVVRGTLRYTGFPEFIKVLVDIGFLRDDEQSFLKEPISWKEATKNIVGASSSNEDDLVSAVSSKTTFKNDDEKNQLVAGLKWRKLIQALANVLLLLSNRGASDLVLQLVSFPMSRLRQRVTHWILYALRSRRRWPIRRVSATWWYVQSRILLFNPISMFQLTMGA